MTKGSKLGVGLDIGTMNIVSARQIGSEIRTMRARDAFIDLDLGDKKTLRLSKVDYVEMDGQLIVLGDYALNMANLFKREIRRPLSRGIIAPGEVLAQQVLSLLVFHVLKEPAEEDEHCFFSVPAAPLDDISQDTTYHTAIFRKIIAEHRYTPHPCNEAMAVIYGACSDTNFSGLAVSMGSGMCNVALAYRTIEGMNFSVARGGDWVDYHAAKALGSTATRMCSIKERGVDLADTAGSREAEALSLHVRALIRYCLENIAQQFRKVQATLELPEPIPFVVSGGTTLAGGFMDVFKSEFEMVRQKGFPIEISEIRAVADPLTSVAEGLLILAGEEHNT
jgi:actin-like ATPase involved in cell morphogenesis